MNTYIVNEKPVDGTQFNAGSKARDDIREIFAGMGAKVVDIECDYEKYEARHNAIVKLWYHFEKASKWKQLLKKMDFPEMIVFQFPVKAHSLFLYRVLRYYKSRNIRTVAVIHDLDCLRKALLFKGNIGRRMTYEEVFCLKEFDKIIVHNAHMKKLLMDNYNIDADKLVSLEIFDYLISDFTPLQQGSDGVIIAGNLEVAKAGYIYSLPEDVRFELYGVGYEDSHKENVKYHGSFLPNDLPKHLDGRFGLVWDGPQTDTCAGIFGSYMKYNDPHKTSLYLSCGIPVIVWDKAAIADFVVRNKCGIVIDDLNNLAEKLSRISDDEYSRLKERAEELGKELRQGEFTRRAFEKCK